MSLRLKTILGIAIIEAVLLAILVSLTFTYLQNTNYQGLDQRAYSTSKLFASSIKDSVLTQDLATVQSFAEELLLTSDITYVSVTDGNGDVIVSVGDAPNDLTTRRFETQSNAVEDGVFDVSTRISEGSIYFGNVWIGFELIHLNKQIEQVKNWSMLIVLGEMVLVALFSYLLGAYLTQRLSQLQRAADDIARGERGVELDTCGKDEVSSVSKAFVNMVERLTESERRTEEYQAKLEKANQSLESKVKERTEALLNANQKLQQSNETLKRTQEKLVASEKMASIGTMAAGVAHEINNPIGAIKSNLQMCSEYLETYQQWVDQYQSHVGAHLSDNQLSTIKQWQEANYVSELHSDFEESLSDASSCADRVTSIVTALQKYSSSSLVQRGEFVTNELFIAISKSINNLSVPADTTIKLMPSVNRIPAFPAVETDIERVFKEVLTNAVQACQRSDSKAPKVIKIMAKHASGQIVVQIADTGDGIKPQHLGRIFDPFYTTQEVGQGMGLGLTYAYDIMRHHNGRIDVRNRQQGGALVTLYFPLSREQSLNNELSDTDTSELNRA